MKPAVAVLGMGRMGSALARALLQAEYPTIVWNRTREKAELLAADGADVKDSVQHAVDAADAVILNVTDYSVSAALLRNMSVSSILRGKLIVELGSGTPDGAREASEWYVRHGASYLDGAILATPDFIGTEAATILVSGPRKTFDFHSETFLALGGNVQHVGDDPGLANALDAAVLSLMWGALFGTLHSIAVCRAEEIDLGELMQQWTATAPVIEGLVSDLIKRTDAGRFASDDETLGSVSIHYSAFHHLLELMESRHIDRSVVDGYDGIFRRAIAAGHLHDDVAALSQFMDKPA